MNFYVIAALGAIVLDPAFYSNDTQITPIEAGRKRKRNSDKAPKISPTMEHIDASLLEDAQDMIMKGLTRCGEFKLGTSLASAAEYLRDSLDSMHEKNDGLSPLLMYTRHFREQ